MRRFEAALLLLGTAAAAQSGSVPLIYCTDLFHPHEDPDDHFDLATLFALDELEVRGILLDQGAQQLARPGSTPIRQLCAITGREVPAGIGLDEKLTSSDDTGASRPAEFQAGVELLLRVLREAERPVVIVQTGSLRDLAAAYNREPGLLRTRVARLYVNSGNAAGAQFEYNAQLDLIAYRRIMESDLPVYWCPCFGGDQVWTGGPHSAWWRFRQGELFDQLSAPLQSYFAYALMRLPPSVDPIRALSEPGLLPLAAEDWRAQAWAQERSMWSTASLLDAAGRPDPSFTFTPATWSFDAQGAVSLEPAEDSPRRVLTVPDEGAYSRAMLRALGGLLPRLVRPQG
ncbi:MAG: hypothetical protein FJX74_05930 [Armatimonadetes bacterium]|nr:hypothetical protein [Armatimonadota bacterium]